MGALIEFVPNVSEGRRPDAVAAIADAAGSARGAALLNVSSDADHNRMVLTLAGSMDGLLDAVRRIYAAALPLIDLREQRGVHPRIGAVDVMPFVPLRGATMADCVRLSHAAARLAAEEFGVPCYLYAESADRPERRRLADLRRGGFEALAWRMAAPGGAPEYGPPRPHPAAGATAVGARGVLIAYNLLLDTSDLGVARAVARAVRASSGGLPGVQALGLPLPGDAAGRAQVSVNIVDHDATPLHVLHAAVQRAAAARGARVVEAELVGMTPQVALARAGAHALGIANYTDALLLEPAIEERLG